MKIGHKPAHWYRQSAVVPYRWHGDELEVALITSRKRKRWIVPKGIVEEDLGPVASAAKEALEEAGVEGTVGDEPLGEYKRKKWGGVCEIRVFPMRIDKIHEDWPEKGARERRFVTIEQAAEMVDDLVLKRMIAELRERLALGFRQKSKHRQR